ncbi:MAG: magnesium/cobalt transporter CorA [Coriobacteriia bacterium]|nr:magnesium/cobalt transporter CorA [Coriobacteriia bacterium]
MTAHVVVRWIAEGVMHADGLSALPDGFAGPVWVDVTEPDEETLRAVAELFPMPPLALEDCLHMPQRPKVDVYPETTFLIWLVPVAFASDGLAVHEIDVFLGEEHLVTIHHAQVDAIDHAVTHARMLLERGVEWTLHAILDEAVDAVFPIVDGLADELETLEDLMLADPRPEHLRRLYAARRGLVRLHKTVGPERDVVRGLARLEAFVEPDAYMYFQDIGDHLARVADQIDTYREVAGTTMDIYLSAQSNRMNQIMKTLTVVATIFMPLTLISGIYGMNFRYMPELQWRFGYFGALGLMLSLGLGMVWYFRRRDWW